MSLGSHVWRSENCAHVAFFAAKGGGVGRSMRYWDVSCKMDPIFTPPVNERPLLKPNLMMNGSYYFLSFIAFSKISLNFATKYH